MKGKSWFKKAKAKYIKQRVHTFNLSWDLNNSYSYNFLDRMERYDVAQEKDGKIIKRLQKIRPEKRFWKARRLAYKNGWSFQYVYLTKKTSEEKVNNE